MTVEVIRVLMQMQNLCTRMAVAGCRDYAVELNSLIDKFVVLTKSVPRKTQPCGECQWCLEDEDSVPSIGGKLPCPRPVTIYGPARPLRPTKPADRK